VPVPLPVLELPGTTSVVTVVVNTLVPFGPSLVVSTVVVVGTGDNVVADGVPVVPIVPNEPVSIVDVDEGMGTVNEAERLSSCWVSSNMWGVSDAPAHGARPVTTSATRSSITCADDITQRYFSIHKIPLPPLILVQDTVYDADVDLPVFVSQATLYEQQGKWR